MTTKPKHTPSSRWNYGWQPELAAAVDAASPTNINLEYRGHMLHIFPSRTSGVLEGVIDGKIAKAGNQGRAKLAFELQAMVDQMV